jgi:hypothetical protein
MKRLFIGLALFSYLFMISCEKEKETPGGIPGMGDTPGRLEIKEAFTLPDGITITGQITGIIEDDKKSGDTKSGSATKTLPSYGSGGKAVKLQVVFTNSSNYPRTVVFPKGLLWECNLPGYQHAIMLQTTWVTVLANSQRSVIIDLYCINWGLEPSYTNSTFNIIGVTASRIMWQLLDLIGWKKINYEMIYHFTYGSKSVASTAPGYDEITEKLQTIVWNLTNFNKPISDDDKAFIESIPELLPEEIPPVNEQGQYPEYFEEYKVIEK